MKTIVPCSSCLTINRVNLDIASQARPICAKCKAYLPIQDGVQQVNSKTLQKLVANAELPIVVDFWAEWCGPCRTFAPIFIEVAQQMRDQVIFAKFNTEDDQDGSGLYRIQAIPTIIVFNNASEIERQSGVMPKSAFKAYLTKFIK